MGMYDTFNYLCPWCDKDTNSQTKLAECELHNLTIGCEFPVEGIITMKDPCEHCGKHSSVVVEDNIIMGFKLPADANKEEKRWGELNDIVRDDDLGMIDVSYESEENSE